MKLEQNQKSRIVVGFEINFNRAKLYKKSSVFGSKFFSARIFAAVLPITKRNTENFNVF
jgi:hypothetical protein